MLDDATEARLVRIERRLAQEDPGLADALRRWRPPEPCPSPRWSPRVLVLGLVLCGFALVFDSVAWLVLLVIMTASGWCLAKGLETQLPPRR